MINNLQIMMPQQTTWVDIERIGSTVAVSGIFGQISQHMGFTIVTICLQNGISLDTFASRYDVIVNKITYKTSYLLSLFVEAGGRIEVLKYTPQEVSISFTYDKYTDGKPYVMTTTYEQYKAKGMIFNSKGQVKDNWKHHSENMLFCRCVTTALRHIAPDVSHGIYTSEEMSDEHEDEDTLITVSNDDVAKIIAQNASAKEAVALPLSQPSTITQEVVTVPSTTATATVPPPTVAPPSTGLPPLDNNFTICKLGGNLNGKEWVTMTTDLLNAAITTYRSQLSQQEAEHIQNIINARNEDK